ncbi:hypothetical protein [Methylobacterium sp. E-046]|uniref:hypothetical protein n=1 Tax=Methylobacterium sp. E-046 TaxID=2836576 RepID=UPI001FBB8F54|nr:hypothetical protein [Methylobacterium sp. E-046]MCJ2098934.1 hypothetical protein [Methylobacterium sp. E-046]
MLYNPPSGSSDPNAPYIRKNVSAGTQGSKVPPEAIEYTQREIVALEAIAGLAPTNTVLVQAAMALGRGIWVGALTGSGDLAVATLGVVLPSLMQGMRIGAVAAATNPSTAPRLRVVNLGSAGAYVDFPILKADGSSLVPGEIVAGRLYRYEADGAGNVLISGGGLGSGALNQAKAAGSPFNSVALPTTQRTNASGSTAGALVTVVTGLTFSKKSASSLLRIGGSFYCHSPVVPGQGSGAVSVRAIVTVLATGATFSDDRILNNTFLTSGGGAAGSGGNSHRFRFAGVPAGSLGLNIALKRDDNLAWNTIYGATGSDLGGLPTPNPSLFEIDELEQIS